MNHKPSEIQTLRRRIGRVLGHARSTCVRSARHPATWSRTRSRCTHARANRESAPVGSRIASASCASLASRHCGCIPPRRTSATCTRTSAHGLQPWSSWAHGGWHEGSRSRSHSRATSASISRGARSGGCSRPLSATPRHWGRNACIVARATRTSPSRTSARTTSPRLTSSCCASTSATLSRRRLLVCRCSQTGTDPPSATAAVSEAIRSVALQAGEPLVRSGGFGRERRRFHEHVLRVTGAQFLARAGLELMLIQLFACWGSAAVLRYVQQAPVSNQQGVARAAIRGLVIKDVDRLAPRMMKEYPDMPQGAVRKAAIDSALRVEPRDMSDTMLVNYNALDARVMLIDASIAESEGSAPGPLLGVRRHRASKLHKVSVGVHDHAAQPVLTTACGWRYGGVPHFIEQLGDSASLFGAFRCYRCFPENRSSSDGTRLRTDESESSSADLSDSSSFS